jgi:hypothetical protein
MTITNKDNLKAINTRHMHAIDKMYRMFAGLSSHLLAYEEGTLTLQVHHSKRWTKDPLTTAKQLAESWFFHNPEFKDAHTYSVYVHSSTYETGFFFTPAKRKDNDSLFTELSKAIAKMPREREPDRIGELIIGRMGA